MISPTHRPSSPDIDRCASPLSAHKGLTLGCQRTLRRTRQRGGQPIALVSVPEWIRGFGEGLFTTMMHTTSALTLPLHTTSAAFAFSRYPVLTTGCSIIYESSRLIPPLLNVSAQINPWKTWTTIHPPLHFDGTYICSLSLPFTHMMNRQKRRTCREIQTLPAARVQQGETTQAFHGPV